MTSFLSTLQNFLERKLTMHSGKAKEKKMRKLVKCFFILKEDMTRADFVALMRELGFEAYAEDTQELLFIMNKVEVVPTTLAEKLNTLFPGENK
jgi:hypothetical protein